MPALLSCLPGATDTARTTWQAVAFPFTFTGSARSRNRQPRLPAGCGQEVSMTRLVGVVLIALALFATRAAAQDPERQSPAKAAAAATASSPVNLNTATASQLEALPGIGARTAALIVEYRQKNGGFKKIEDLMNVRGVGEKSFLKLKPLVTVTPPKTERAGQQ
jgi:competence protein ComEA